MQSVSKIIIGWVLVGLGVSIIFYSVFSSLNIFTGKTEVFGVFSVQETNKENSGIIDVGGKSVDVGKLINEQLSGILPQNSLPKTLNLVAWSIFAWILISAGGQIAGIGIKLLKN